MKIIVPGGSGFIGRALCSALVRGGHQVAVLSRNPREAACVLDPVVTVVGWDGVNSGIWEHALEGSDAIINLAGEPIADKRWTAQRKMVIRQSRIGTTKLLVEAFARLSQRPTILINGSGIGYYGSRDSTPTTEETPAGTGFLAELCVAWEDEAKRAEDLGLRVVRLRTGMVLGTDGGALPRMILPFRLFAGGPILPGDQWVSWIHLQDHIGLIQWALSNHRIAGSLNGVAPEPVTMREFCRKLGHVLGRPSWLPVPAFVLELALGELATVMTTGQRVTPTVALRDGYSYQYPELETALRVILAADMQKLAAAERR
jgi:uncharacterized protein (TIGR01777 family)